MLSRNLRRCSTALVAILAASMVHVAIAAAGPQTEGSQLRIGTYNIRAGVPLAEFREAVDQSKALADVIGLQEIGSNDRNKYLVDDHDWGYYRPPALQQNPIIWRRDHFDFLAARGYKIAKKRDLHGEHSGDEAKGDSWVTMVRLRDRTSAQEISFINVHLVRGAVKGGRPAPKRPNLFKLYTDQVAGLIRAVKKERAISDRVYVLGDFNVGFKADQKRHHKKLPYRKFKRIGFQSMWQDSPFLNEPYGTRNDALIDQIFTVGPAADEKIHREIDSSDHWFAVGVYDLPAPPPGYQPGEGSAGFGDVRLEANGNRPGDTENNGPSKIPSMFVPIEGDLRYGYVEVEIIEHEAKLSPDGNEPGDFAVDTTTLFDNDFTNNEIAIDIVGDRRVEGDETFTLRLVLGASTRIEPQADEITLTIIDDD